MAKSVEARLQEMEDREAIRELPLKYCDLVWKKDVPAIVNLFTEDGEFDAGGAVAPAKGRAGLLKAYNEGLGLDPRPYIHNHVFELQSSTWAKGNCYLDLRATQNGKSMIASGYYDDVYKKVGDEWKFRSRKFHILFWTPLTEGWAEQKK